MSQPALTMHADMYEANGNNADAYHLSAEADNVVRISAVADCHILPRVGGGVRLYMPPGFTARIESAAAGTPHYVITVVPIAARPVEERIADIIDEALTEYRAEHPDE